MMKSGKVDRDAVGCGMWRIEKCAVEFGNVDRVSKSDRKCEGV